MKKLWLLSLLALSAGPGVAQQISGSFDGKWEDCFPNGGTTKVGVQPAGWGASNVYQVMSFKQLVTQGANRDTTVADVDSCYSAHLLNYFCGLGSLGATAPAYITLGDAWNYGDYANLNTENDKSDGGAYGGVEFAYRPDSISLWVKRIHQTEEAKSGTINPEEKATVLLYSWKGSTSSTMRIGLEMAVLGNAHDITMVDRDKDVLGMVTEGVTKSEDFELVATSENYIEGDYAEWTKLTFPINYVTASVPEKLNIVIASADYFNRPNLGVGNTLDVDDVELIYNSQLATLTYDGETVPGFAPDNYEVLDMTSVVYADSLLAYTSNGAGATVETSYNDVLAMLTVTVKGNDHKTNSKNEHTYQIRFKPASVPLTSYYQIPNGDFEGTWTEQKRGGYTEKTPASWNSFYAANTENLGVLGNLAFSMNQVGQLSQDSVAPHSGKYSAKIESTKNMLGTVSNGNLTTGIVYMGSMIASDSTNFNFSDMDNETGCLPFSGTPDSLKVWVKFVPKVDTLGNASVNAILHTDAGYMDPNGIMSREAEAASRIASAYSEITPSGEWVSYSIPFAYNGDLITTYEGQKYLLLSFSTNAKPGVGSDDDALYVDDVEVVYNSQLATLTYDGETVPGFVPDNYEVLDLSSVDFEESKLAYTSNGAGATVETSYDKEKAVLTLTVKGNDYEVNSENEHIYKVQFKLPVPVGIDGVEAGQHNGTAYDLQGRPTSKDGKGILIINGKKVMKK